MYYASLNNWKYFDINFYRLHTNSFNTFQLHKKSSTHSTTPYKIFDHRLSSSPYFKTPAALEDYAKTLTFTHNKAWKSRYIRTRLVRVLHDDPQTRKPTHTSEKPPRWSWVAYKKRSRSPEPSQKPSLYPTSLLLAFVPSSYPRSRFCADSAESGLTWTYLGFVSGIFFASKYIFFSWLLLCVFDEGLWAIMCPFNCLHLWSFKSSEVHLRRLCYDDNVVKCWGLPVLFFSCSRLKISVFYHYKVWFLWNSRSHFYYKS